LADFADNLIAGDVEINWREYSVGFGWSFFNVTGGSVVFRVERIVFELFGETIKVNVLMFGIDEKWKPAFHVFLLLSVLLYRSDLKYYNPFKKGPQN
jgi:hypothetical protein